MQAKKTTVLIVEDNPLVRWALRNYLEHHAFEVVGEAASSAEAIDLASLHRPGVVLLDLMMDEGSVVETTRAINRTGSSKVLAFSAYRSPEQLEAFLRAGGCGFVPKSSPVDELKTAINAVTNNRQWLSPEIAGQVRAQKDRDRRNPMLSEREREVAVLISKGLPSSQVAARLFVSLNTVETHRYRIFKKLGIHSRAELVDYVLKFNLMGNPSTD